MIRSSTLDLLATMEEARAEEEEALFENLPQSRQGAAEHNVTPEGYSTAWLNAARGRILGPARAQEVQRGDSITLSVFGKYVDKRKVRLLPASLVKAKASPETLRQLTELGQQYRAAGPNQLLLYHAVHLVLADLQRKPVPEAYMGYALYDADSNMYDSGKVPLSKKARNEHEELRKKIYIAEDGHMEAYLVNETEENVGRVRRGGYDDFSIMSDGFLVVQETHYDPWGLELTGLGYQYGGGVKANRYLYNAKEFEGHLGLNLHDYGARMYDAAIGRWFVVDPLAELAPGLTPFRYGFNNPVRFTDPSGMFEYSDGYSTQDSRNITGAVSTVSYRQDDERGSLQTDPLHGRPVWMGQNYNVNASGKRVGSVFRYVEYEDGFRKDLGFGWESGGMIWQNGGGISIGNYLSDDLFTVTNPQMVGGTVPFLPGGIGGWSNLKNLSGLAKDLRRIFDAAKGARALPSLDATGKVHGTLPKVRDFGRYSIEELQILLKELRQSVQTRIKVTSKMGRDQAHGQRQGAEQDLIKSLEKYLGQ
ncbi:RHS repeat domain-containing protein [Negadavirga shengliensis]|uniref:RHS repeat domain-containing protein n=1 Tax=Negadavirga shengliensis TaxID=1389218 RepID=A0ABV9T694_9BACT